MLAANSLLGTAMGTAVKAVMGTAMGTAVGTAMGAAMGTAVGTAMGTAIGQCMHGKQLRGQPWSFTLCTGTICTSTT
jgi:uncharacterized protein YcfJ